MLRYDTLEQGSAEWLVVRAGRITSSEAEHVLPLSALFPPAKGAGRDNETGRQALALRLAIERVTHAPVLDDSFTPTAAMARGTALEAEARRQYQARHPELTVTTVGFLADDALAIGTSPDGLCAASDGTMGGVEIKCPGPVAHWEYRTGGVLPRRYVRQVLHHLLVTTEAAWWDFVSYHPAFPGALAWAEVRVTREALQPWLTQYAEAVTALLATVDTLAAQMQAEA